MKNIYIYSFFRLETIIRQGLCPRFLLGLFTGFIPFCVLPSVTIFGVLLILLKASSCVYFGQGPKRNETSDLSHFLSALFRHLIGLHENVLM